MIWTIKYYKKRLTCGILAIKLKIHDNNSIIFPRLLASFKLRGCKIAKYLSKLIVTSINDDKYSPNVRKNISILHAISPPFHATVACHAISMGNIMNATIRSARDKWRINKFTLDFKCLLRNRVMNTVKFPPAAITNRTEYATTAIKFSSLKVKSFGSSPTNSDLFLLVTLKFVKLLNSYNVTLSNVAVCIVGVGSHNLFVND